MSVMWNLVRKDIRGLRVVVWLWLAVLAVVTAAGALVPVLVGYKGLDMTARTLLMLKPFLQYLMVALIVPLLIHQDPLVEARAFWLTRPISRRTLLAGKAVFLALVVVLPVLAGELITLACNGLGPRCLLFATPEILLEIVSKVCLIGVLAVLTRNFGQYAVALVAYMFTFGVLSFGINAVITHLLPDLRNVSAMMTTGVLQTQAFAGWLATIAIGGSVVAWQFLTRRSRPAIIVGVLGMVCVITLKGSLPFNAFGGLDSGKVEKPANLSISVQDVHPSAENSFMASFAARSLAATMNLSGTLKSRYAEVVSGRATLTYPDTRILEASVSAALDESGFLRSDLTSKGTAVPFMAEALERGLGSIHLLNGSFKVPQSVVGMPILLTLKKSGSGFDSLLGKSGSVTGTAEVALSEYRISGIERLQEGSVMVTGLDHDRVVAVTADSVGAQVAIRKTRAMISIGGGKSGQNMKDRMLPQSEYALLNRSKSNEVALCASAEPDDLLFMMTMVSRLGLPPRLDHIDMKLVFPPLSKEWLKDAELVCLEKHVIASWELPFGATNVVIQPTGKGAEASPVQDVVRKPALEGDGHL